MFLPLVLAAMTTVVRVSPGESIDAALSSLRRNAPAPREVLLATGTHRLAAPLLLTGADSFVTIRGEPGAVLSSGVPLNFSAAGGGLWSADLPAALQTSGVDLGTLYVNGGRRLRARAPNAVGTFPWSYAALVGDAATFLMAGPLAECDKPAFGTCPAEDSTGFFSTTTGARAPNSSWDMRGAVVGVAEAWTFEYAPLSAYDGASGRVSFAAPIATPVGAFGTGPGTPCGGRWFLEGVRDALDAPGEFFVDAASSRVLYFPLPAEAAAGPAAAAAEMPSLTALWKVAGTAAAPAVNITLRDVAVRLWADAPGAREKYPGAYAGALHIGPFAEGIAVRNVSVAAGATNAFCVAGSVRGAALDRLTISDIGGRALEGCAAALSFSVVGLTVSNSTISKTNYNYMSGGAINVVGTDAAFVHNELFDVPLMGVTVEQAGGPSRASAPRVEIAYNRIRDYGGRDVLSDFGGVYISTNSDATPATNWLAASVHHNLISNAASYNYGANGLYSDHGTSGPAFFSNVVVGMGGRGLSPHAGLNVSAVNNVFFNVSVQPFAGSTDASCVVSGPQGHAPGFSALLRNNILAQPAGGSPVFYSTRDALWAPPDFVVASDANVFWAAGAEGVFPDGKGGETGLAGWRAATDQDAASAEADPRLADPEGGDFTVLPDSPAWGLGWQEIDLSNVGPLAAHVPSQP